MKAKTQKGDGMRKLRQEKPATAAPGLLLKPTPIAEAIQKRAYEIYLARGNGPDNARSDWLQAERELSQP